MSVYHDPYLTTLPDGLCRRTFVSGGGSTRRSVCTRESDVLHGYYYEVLERVQVSLQRDPLHYPVVGELMSSTERVHGETGVNLSPTTRIPVPCCAQRTPCGRSLEQTSGGVGVEVVPSPHDTRVVYKTVTAKVSVTKKERKILHYITPGGLSTDYPRNR